MMEMKEENKIKLFRAVLTLVIILSAYFAVGIFSEIKKDTLLGESATPATISFSGHGEVQAVPDIANVSFTINKDDKTVASAQADVAVVEKSALDFLQKNNVDSKDIQTENASFNPTYEYQNSICPQIGGTTQIYCPPSRQVLTGYTASESITVKVRNLDNVGRIMQGLGGLGVTDLNGPNFAIDNPDAVQEQARELAINDAKAKAVALAKDLGVSLGKITSFSESANSPMPIYNNVMAMDVAPKASTPAVIPAGQNTITSDVTITYEIR